MKPHTAAKFIVLAIIVMMTAITGCSAEGATEVTTAVEPAGSTSAAVADRGLITVNFKPG